MLCDKYRGPPKGERNDTPGRAGKRAPGGATAYMSDEQDKTIQFPPKDLDDFIPAVAKGEWNPNK